MTKTGMKGMIIGIFILLIGVVVLVCNLIVNRSVAGHTFEDIAAIPENKVGLVLGTSPTLSNGKSNYYFTYRMDAAAELYKAGKILYVLVSGDNHRASYNEPEEMKKALMERGVPEGAIYLDYAGFRTLDSVIRAKKIFGQDRITIISQKFHNERAIYLASWYHIEAVGYNAKDVRIKAGLKTKVREWFARVKVFMDLLFHKQPRF